MHVVRYMSVKKYLLQHRMEQYQFSTNNKVDVQLKKQNKKHPHLRCHIFAWF